MSDDLISRKAVLNILTEARVKDSILCSPAFVEILTQRIKKISTAFDKEKVIDDLENLKNNLIDCNDLCGECLEIECDQCALKKAIEIVEKGGIE